MRKVLSTLLIACALVFAAASLASGATAKRCGTLYKPPCTKPTIKVRPIPPACKPPRSTFTLPIIKFHSIAGIRKITVSIGSTFLYEKTFKGSGPTNYTVKGIKVHTKPLKTGAQKIKIFVKDIGGRTRTKFLRFTVCPPPRFTG
jgi:hypothetical protein